MDSIFVRLLTLLIASIYFIFILTFLILDESLFVSILYAIGGGIILTLISHVMFVVLWNFFWSVIIKTFGIVKRNED